MADSTKQPPKAEPKAKDEKAKDEVPPAEAEESTPFRYPNTHPGE